MAHTDKMRVITAAAKTIQKITGGGVPVKIIPPIAGMIMTPTTNVSDPKINNVQTVIVARALKIGGISPSFLLYSMTLSPLFYSTDCQLLTYFIYRPYRHSIEDVVKLNTKVEIRRASWILIGVK